MLPLISIGTNISLGMAACALIGYYIDVKTANENHIWTLGGTLLGLVYGGYEVWKMIRTNKKENSSDK